MIVAGSQEVPAPADAAARYAVFHSLFAAVYVEPAESIQPFGTWYPVGHGPLRALLVFIVFPHESLVTVGDDHVPALRTSVLFPHWKMPPALVEVDTPAS